jgi:hypothetical protein
MKQEKWSYEVQKVGKLIRILSEKQQMLAGKIGGNRKMKNLCFCGGL